MIILMFPCLMKFESGLEVVVFVQFFHPFFSSKAPFLVRCIQLKYCLCMIIELYVIKEANILGLFKKVQVPGIISSEFVYSRFAYNHLSTVAIAISLGSN